MKTATRITAAAAGVLAALTIGACSDPAPGPDATPTAVEEADSPDSNAEAEAPEPAEPEEPMELPVEGEIVASGDIDEARELGADVYVSPTGDGSGVVIDPGGETPEVIVRDIEALPAAMGTPEDVADAFRIRTELDEAITAAGSGAFMLTEAPHIQQGEVVGIMYVVRPFGDYPEIEEFKATVVAHESKSAAIADAQPFMDANPDFAFIDATR